MAENQLNRQLAAGIRAAQQGDRARARELLEGVLRRDRNNEQGWIWLASVVDSPKERRLSLERVLKINPNNQPAQQALNSMVGVLSGGDDASIDYAAISAAARTPPPSGRRGGGSPAPQQRGGAGGGNNMIPLLIGAAVVLGLLLAGSIFIPPLLQPEPTATPIPPTETATVDPDYTPPPPTIAPTATFDSESTVEVSIDVTSPPTFTPTATLPPTDTPEPTATVPPLTDYSFLILGIQGSASPSIYRVNGDGADLAIVLQDVDDFDYNPATGMIVFTRRQFVQLPTFTPVPTATPLPVSPTPGGSQGGGFTLQPGGDTTVVQSQMFITNINDLNNITEVTSSTLPSAYAPSISPDGNSIAFVSDVDGDDEIYLLNVATLIASKLTDNAVTSDTYPAWSPDGSRLVFSSDRSSAGNNDLFTLDPFAASVESSVEPVTSSRGMDIEPQWSSTTNQLVFLNINGDENTVRIGSVDGRLTRDVTFQPDWTFTSPIWTEDGNYVIYSSSAPDSSELQLRVYGVLDRDERTVRTNNITVLKGVIR